MLHRPLSPDDQPPHQPLPFLDRVGQREANGWCKLIPPPFKSRRVLLFYCVLLFFAGFYFHHPCFWYVLKMLNMDASLATVAEAREYAWATETDPGESGISIRNKGICNAIGNIRDITNIRNIRLSIKGIYYNKNNVMNLNSSITITTITIFRSIRVVILTFIPDDPDVVAVALFAEEKEKQFQQVRKNFNRGKGTVNSTGKKFHYTPPMRIYGCVSEEKLNNEVE